MRLSLQPIYSISGLWPFARFLKYSGSLPSFSFIQTWLFLKICSMFIFLIFQDLKIRKPCKNFLFWKKSQKQKGNCAEQQVKNPKFAHNGKVFICEFLPISLSNQ